MSSPGGWARTPHLLPATTGLEGGPACVPRPPLSFVISRIGVRNVDPMLAGCQESDCRPARGSPQVARRQAGVRPARAPGGDSSGGDSSVGQLRWATAQVGQLRRRAGRAPGGRRPVPARAAAPFPGPPPRTRRAGSGRAGARPVRRARSLRPRRPGRSTGAATPASPIAASPSSSGVSHGPRPGRAARPAPRGP